MKITRYIDQTCLTFEKYLKSPFLFNSLLRTEYFYFQMSIRTGGN